MVCGGALTELQFFNEVRTPLNLTGPVDWFPVSSDCEVPVRATPEVRLVHFV